MGAIPKRLRTIITIAEQQGWLFKQTSSGHPQLIPPKGATDPQTGRLAVAVTFGKTPSDIRGDLNAVSYLRRNGVDIPRKGHTPKKQDR